MNSENQPRTQQVSTQTFKYELTPSQQAIYKETLNLVSSDLTDVIQLLGPAGTGKSVLIAALVRYFKTEEKPFMVAAPTGSASFNLSKRIGVPVSTLHRQLYEYEGIEEVDDEYFIMKFRLKTGISRPEVIIVDEAGMISDTEQSDGVLTFGSGRVLYDLISFVKKFEIKPKIIFVGDPYQISPSTLENAPCLSASYLEKNYGLSVNTLELTEIKRQSDPFLIQTLDYLRQKMINRDESAIKWTDEGPKGIASTAVSNSFVNRNPLRLPGHSVVIAFSNKQIAEHNRAIRKEYGFTEVLHAGELLLNIRTLYLNENDTLLNGTVLFVEHCGTITETRTVSLREKNKTHTLVELNFRNAVVRVVGDDEKTDYEVKVLENALLSNTSGVDQQIWRALYVDFLMRNSDLVERKKTAKLVQSTYNEWLVEFGNRLRKDRYFNALMTKYGYAITGHRSQGHEWNSVFVDLDYRDIHSLQGLRWLYTACSRTQMDLQLIHKEKTNFFSKCESAGIDYLRSIPAGFYASRVSKVTEKDPSVVQQFPFLKPFVEKLKAVEYRFNAHLDILYGNYFIRTIWLIDRRSYQFDFGYSKKGIKEILIKTELYANSPVVLDLLREIQTNTDTVNLTKSCDSEEAHFRKFLIEASDLYGIRLCNVIYQTEFQHVYYLESNEGKAVLLVYRNDKKRYTSLRISCELGPKSDGYIRFFEWLLTQ